MNIKDLLESFKSLSFKEQRELFKELSKVVKKPEIKKIRPIIEKIKPRKIVLSKRSLSKSVREGLTDKQLAETFNVSERTISRRIKEYGLKGLRPYGKRPLKPEWILTSEYIKQIKRKYHPVTAQTPKQKFVNTFDFVCSKRREYPRGKYFAYSVYFIVNYSEYLRYIFVRTIQYSDKPVPFKEIRDFALRKTPEILSKMFYHADYWVGDLIAFEFHTKKEHSIILPEYKTSLISKEDKVKEIKINE